MTHPLRERIARGLDRKVDPAVRAFAERLAAGAGAQAVLFYGSNLRTGELEGVLDYYLLMPGEAEKGLWPRVSYHEWAFEGTDLRAKVATMTMAKFAGAASGKLLDTTIWARFVQPSALIWAESETARAAVVDALGDASKAAARLAVALGPESGTEADYWTALFEATYGAEFRMETTSRARSIIELNAAHFDGLLPLAMSAAGIEFAAEGEHLHPAMPQAERREIRRWWRARRRAGKPLNLLRLVRAASTFEGAARYAAWKIERHTGVPVEITPWRERHPVLAAPGVLFSVWRRRRAAAKAAAD
ncbi:MAG: hypothetical protein KDE32_00025 [Novosphingobium sp.]|nr:hypothetical protein [Novosphingobium sp.]